MGEACAAAGGLTHEARALAPDEHFIKWSTKPLAVMWHTIIISKTKAKKRNEEKAAGRRQK